MTRKQQTAFPEVGTVHKGAPKQDNRWGDDLEERFRIEFAPDTTDAQLRFYNAYGNYHPTELRAMFVSTSVWDTWYFANEAYSRSNQRIAVADDNQVLHLRNPATGEVLIRNGEPFTEFVPGQAFCYERGDRKYEIKLRPTGRLSLFLPELEQFVSFTLRTTA